MSVISLEERIVEVTVDKDGEYLSNLKRLTVGSGDKTMRNDENGLFLGADNFTDAPFSVDYDGNMKSTTGTFSGNTNWANVQAGTNANALNVGAGNVKIDGANKRIIINDGTNDRVLIGYLAGKF